MSQTYATINQASQTGTVVFGHLADRTDTLRSSFSGTSSPSTPVTGQFWYDTSNEYVSVYGDIDGGGASFHRCLTDYNTLNVDMNDYQFLNVRVENLSADEAASAGTVGKLWLNTTGNYLAAVLTSTKVGKVMAGAATDYISVPLPIDSWGRDATNPPTVTDVGTTPSVRGWLFDATNEQASTQFQVPAGFADSADCKLRVWLALNAAETANDTIDATFDYVAITPDANEVLTKTSTQSTVAFDIGSNTAQYSVHQVDFTIDYDDATNPIDAGDIICGEFALSSVASVPGVIFLGAAFLAPYGGTVLDS